MPLTAFFPDSIGELGTRIMRNIAKGLGLLLSSLLLFGCGEDDPFGGSNGSGNGNKPGTVGTAASVQLLSSSPQLPASDVSSVTLTAVVKDGSNAVLEGVDVHFEASSGELSIVRSVTDAAGTAEAKLTTTSDKANRPITVTASTNSISTSNTIQVIGTTLRIAGPSALPLGSSSVLNITLMDADGNGISGQNLAVTSSKQNTILPQAPQTGASGATTVELTANNPGDDTITVTGAGTTAVFALNVSGDRFVFQAPAPGIDVELNTSETVTIEWKENNSPVSGRDVAFTTTRGDFGGVMNTIVTTDSQGKASVNISSSSAGPAMITASGVGGPSAQISVYFKATDVAKISLQAHPENIGPGEQSEIIALVRDPNDNPVKGVDVSFGLLDDITGGRIDSGIDTTDEHGLARTKYTAGQVPSAQDGIRIKATVVPKDTVSAETTLTVAQRAFFIALGTGNDIEEPDDERYWQVYQVMVTDGNANPVPNAIVSLGLWPVQYAKGSYLWATKQWVQALSDVCDNEDVNRNGFLDPGEDHNNSGSLEPGTVATVPSTVTTDENGFASFKVTYLQEHANWASVELRASTTVAGSEGTTTRRFWLPIASKDLSKEDTSPPGALSPFGVSTCGDPF